jgi:hypothetical protein
VLKKDYVIGLLSSIGILIGDDFIVKFLVEINRLKKKINLSSLYDNLVNIIPNYNPFTYRIYGDVKKINLPFKDKEINLFKYIIKKNNKTQWELMKLLAFILNADFLKKTHKSKYAKTIINIYKFNSSKIHKIAMESSGLYDGYFEDKKDNQSIINILNVNKLKKNNKNMFIELAKLLLPFTLFYD